MFEEAPIPKKIRDPDSSFSGWWDLMQVIFLLYVAYAVPIRVGFSVDVKTGSIWFLIGVVIDIYFIVDLFMNFRTAYWKENGMLEVDPRSITINYLKCVCNLLTQPVRLCLCVLSDLFTGPVRFSDLGLQSIYSVGPGRPGAVKRP